MQITRWLVVAGALALPASALLWLPVTVASAPPAAAQPAPVQAAPAKAHVLGSQAVAAEQWYNEMLSAAGAVHANMVLPTPGDPTRAAAAHEPDVAPVAEAPSQSNKDRIALFYTGNVIGETDPCG